MNIMFLHSAAVLYLLATAAYWLYFSNKSELRLSVAAGLSSGGFLLHTASILVRMIESGYFPLTKVYESISFFTWALVVAFFMIDRKYKIHALGTFVLPLVLVALAGSLFLPKSITPIAPMLKSNWFVVHTVFSITGFVFFGVSFSAGIMYLLQDRMLKKKKLTVFFHKLPPLNVLDDLSQKMISTGFLLLTVGITSGCLWARIIFGKIFIPDPKMMFAFLTWFFYLMVIHGRYSSGWRAKKGAYLSVFGFGGVMLMFLLSTLFSGTGWHAFL